MRAALIALFFCSACYRYTAVESSRVTPGTNVRARVSAQTAERLEPLLGVSDARLLSGQIVSVAPDTLIVQVPTSARTYVGSSVYTLQQRVSIPRTGILEIEESRLDRTRTTAVALAGAAAVAAVVAKVVVKEGGGIPPGGGGGGPELRFPLSLRW